MEPIRQWVDILKVLDKQQPKKTKLVKPRFVYPAQQSFENEDKIKTFPYKKNLRAFVAGSSARNSKGNSQDLGKNDSKQ